MDGDGYEVEGVLVKHIESEEICEENNPKKANISEAYVEVLAGNREFICITEEGQKFTIDGNYVKNAKGEEAYRVLYFSIADMDRDGEAEVVLTCDYATLILHNEEDILYGYLFDVWNEMSAIAKDGAFVVGLNNTYGKIVSFEKDKCVIETVDGYENMNENRIRYLFFSEEAVAEN